MERRYEPDDYPRRNVQTDCLSGNGTGPAGKRIAESS